MTSSIIATPTITVLMSCFNAARWLEESINSVLNQSYTDFEFIIVDDGSADNTLDIIYRFAATDSRIVAITKSNSGPSDSLNVGLKIAKGEWIARLDADDVCEPTRLEKQAELAFANSNLVFIGTGLTIIDDAGNKVIIYNYPADHAGLLQHLRTSRKFPPHSSVLYRTKIVRNLCGYRSRFHQAEDWDLWLRLSEVGELACLSVPLVQIRKHAEQISHSEGGRRQMIDSRLATVSYWLRYFQMPDPVEADEIDFKKFSAWIELHLQKTGFFEFQEYKAYLISLVNDALSSSLGIIRLVCVCIKKPILTLRFFREQLVGESITRRLALEWIRQSKVS